MLTNTKGAYDNASQRTVRGAAAATMSVLLEH
jgi:hypothetical protein